jgi:hypothetical protein
MSNYKYSEDGTCDRCEKTPSNGDALLQYDNGLAMAMCSSCWEAYMASHEQCHGCGESVCIVPFEWSPDHEHSYSYSSSEEEEEPSKDNNNDKKKRKRSHDDDEEEEEPCRKNRKTTTNVEEVDAHACNMGDDCLAKGAYFCDTCWNEGFTRCSECEK